MKCLTTTCPYCFNDDMNRDQHCENNVAPAVYRYLIVDDSLSVDTCNLKEKLDLLSIDGWEVVTSVGTRLVLRRMEAV